MTPPQTFIPGTTPSTELQDNCIEIESGGDLAKGTNDLTAHRWKDIKIFGKKVDLKRRINGMDELAHYYDLKDGNVIMVPSPMLPIANMGVATTATNDIWKIYITESMKAWENAKQCFDLDKDPVLLPPIMRCVNIKLDGQDTKAIIITDPNYYKNCDNQKPMHIVGLGSYLHALQLAKSEENIDPKDATYEDTQAVINDTHMDSPLKNVFLFEHTKDFTEDNTVKLFEHLCPTIAKFIYHDLDLVAGIDCGIALPYYPQEPKVTLMQEGKPPLEWKIALQSLRTSRIFIRDEQKQEWQDEDGRTCRLSKGGLRLLRIAFEMTPEDINKLSREELMMRYYVLNISEALHASTDGLLGQTNNFTFATHVIKKAGDRLLDMIRTEYKKLVQNKEPKHSFDKLPDTVDVPALKINLSSAAAERAQKVAQEQENTQKTPENPEAPKGVTPPVTKQEQPFTFVEKVLCIVFAIIFPVVGYFAFCFFRNKLKDHDTQQPTQKNDNDNSLGANTAPVPSLAEERLPDDKLLETSSNAADRTSAGPAR